MKYEWDDVKRKHNLKKHGIDFADAESLFDNFTLTIEDIRLSYGEQRFSTIGLLNGRVVVVVHPERKDAIRIISIRKATRNEQKMYFTEFPH